MKNILFILVVIIGTFSLRSDAIAADPLLQTSNMCSRYFAYYEREYNIPHLLLKSISINESGVFHKESNRRVPWPWAINVQGKPYYFDSKAEAVAKVRSYLRKGVTSIDVGCMQINLRYHPQAFRSLEQAFEPRYNIAYAADFLYNHYQKHRGWRKAIGAYHSETASYGTPYAERILATWQKEKSHYATPVYAVSRTAAPAAAGQAAKRNVTLFTASTPKKDRRKSDLFVRVRPSSSYQYYPSLPSNQLQMVENLTQDVLQHPHGSKAGARSKTVID